MAWNTRQSGNIMLALFAAVGMVGMVGATGMAIMKGPVRAMAQVTKRTIAENNMIASAKLAVIAAGTQGDCDGDGLIETMAWSTSGTGPVIMGGGYLPATIGASLQDPWGNTYSYCSWDMGSQIKKATPVPACPTPAQRLSGVAVPTNQTVIAIISSGPNRIFETTCGNNPAYVTKVSGSDDVIQSYTYAEANAIGAGLWNLKSANLNVAEIKKDLEVKNAANNVVFGVDATSDINKPSIKVDYIKALSQPSVEFLSPVAGINFSGSGAGLTSLNAANLTSGTVAPARLGSGTASATTLLRGNGTWAAEADPKVGAVTNGKWCRGSGTQVICDQAAPEDGTLQSQTITNTCDVGGNAGDDCITTATCPSGYIVTGGGGYLGSSYRVVLGQPSGSSGWTCRFGTVVDVSGTSTATCYARCIRLTS